MDHKAYNELKVMVKEAMVDSLVKKAGGANMGHLLDSSTAIHSPGAVRAALDAIMNAGRDAHGAVAGGADDMLAGLGRQVRSVDPRGSTGIKDYFAAGDRSRAGADALHGFRVKNSVPESDAGHTALAGAINKDVLKTALKRKILAGSIGGAGALGLGGAAYGMSRND